MSKATDYSAIPTPELSRLMRLHREDIERLRPGSIAIAYYRAEIRRIMWEIGRRLTQQELPVAVTRTEYAAAEDLRHKEDHGDQEDQGNPPTAP